MFSKIAGSVVNPLCPQPADVIAIVVTYRHDRDTLKTLLDALLPQVRAMVVVDNGSDRQAMEWLAAGTYPNLTLIALGENKGIAAAQNIGIDWARQQGAEFVLLSDQDSLPAPDMIARLVAGAREKQAAGCRLAAVGPRYFDIHQGNLRPFVQLRGFSVRRFDCGGPEQMLEVDHLIASGSLISVAVLDDVGVMAEPLFIDYVDTEWCLRAWRKGYQLFGVCEAVMHHGLGEEPNYFSGRYVPVHAPLRHYYLFRNGVWLSRQKWIPLNWKLATMRRLVLVFMYFSLLQPDRLAQMRMMLRGLGDGLKNRMGQYVA